MLTIVPADERRCRLLAQTYGFSALQGMVAHSGDREEGIGVYVLQKDTLELVDIQAEDPLVLDGLLRAILNTGYRGGAKWAVCRHTRLTDVLRAEGFLATENGMRVDIAAFFARPCRGGTE